MAAGKVKWFNYNKGYGFIESNDGGKDVFLHISAVEQAGIQNIAEGTAVSYDIVEEKGKESAANLKLT